MRVHDYNNLINALSPGVERKVYGYVNESLYKNSRAYEPDGVCARDCDGLLFGDAVEAPSMFAVRPSGILIGCCVSSGSA